MKHSVDKAELCDLPAHHVRHFTNRSGARLVFPLRLISQFNDLFLVRLIHGKGERIINLQVQYC